jgi:hypothetical protein
VGLGISIKGAAVVPPSGPATAALVASPDTTNTCIQLFIGAPSVRMK